MKIRVLQRHGKPNVEASGAGKPINRVENLDDVKFEHNTMKVVIMNPTTRELDRRKLLCMQ
jgi:hypothetical protein